MLLSTKLRQLTGADTECILPSVVVDIVGMEIIAVGIDDIGICI